MKFHKTKDGKKIKLADLETSHLENIIKWIERKSKEGLTVRMGGGLCAEDMWYDEETYYGEEAKNIYFFDEDFKRYESLLISLSKNEEQRVQINLLKEQYTKLFADKELMIRGKIGYEDKYGNLYDFKVKFTITTPRKNPRVGFQISQESI